MGISLWWACFGRSENSRELFRAAKHEAKSLCLQGLRFADFQLRKVDFHCNALVLSFNEL